MYFTKARLVARCPYCGHDEQGIIDEFASRRTIILCDCDSGGCDNYFLAGIITDVKYEVVGKGFEGMALEKRVITFRMPKELQ